MNIEVVGTMRGNMRVGVIYKSQLYWRGLYQRFSYTDSKYLYPIYTSLKPAVNPYLLAYPRFILLITFESVHLF